MQAGRSQGGDVVYDAALSREAVLRVQDRINGLIPAGARVLECGAGPISAGLLNRFEYTLIDSGRSARRWDIPAEHLISAPLRQAEGATWFHNLDEERLPKSVDLLLLHDIAGVLDAAGGLEMASLLKRSAMVVVVGDDGERLARLMQNLQHATALIDDPDVGMWLVSFSEDVENTPAKRLDPITRCFHVLGWKGLESRRLRGLLNRGDSSIQVREGWARLLAAPGTWEEGSHAYSDLFDESPGYRDVAWQLLRTSIYAARWSEVGRVLLRTPEFKDDPRIKEMLEKKFELIAEQATVSAIEQIVSAIYRPEWIVRTWAELDIGVVRNFNAAVSHVAADSIPGPHLGHRYLRMIELGDQELLREHIEHAVESYGIVDTLASICVNEHLPDELNDIVRSLLSRCETDTVHAAIRAIGRRGDPAQYVGRTSILKMIDAGTSIQTWMIEFALRSEDRSMLDALLSKPLPGTADAIIDSFDHLIAMRRDDRTVYLLEAIAAEPSLMVHQPLRRAMSKALLVVAEPTVAHAFAMESVRLEPQDAVCASVALDAAIATGDSELILSTADVVLNMRSRSSKVDYASIAIAAIRRGRCTIADDILRRNRVRMDLRAQRIRVGLAFHEQNDPSTALEYLEQVPAKFSKDPTLMIYKAKSLAALLRHEEAEAVAQSLQDESERAALLYSLRRSWNDAEGAAAALNSALLNNSQLPLPDAWTDGGFQFHSLHQTETKPVQNRTGRFVTVIMTTHKWNDAFPLAVASVLNQTHAHLELIVVDDHSPEADVAKYDALLTDDRIVRIRMEQNVGTYACRNKGLEVARGEFVTFADSDDWNHPERIARGLAMMQERSLDVCLGRYLRMSADGQILFNGGRLSRFSLVTMLIRRSTMERYSFRFDGRARFSADSELFERMRIRLGNERVHRHQGLDLIALHHDGSLTGGGAQAIGWTGPGEDRLRYVNGYRRYHGMLRVQHDHDASACEFSAPTSNLLPEEPTPLERRVREAFGLIESADASQTTNIDASADITAFMATYPGGFDHVGNAVRTLLRQSLPLSRLVLHVNGDRRPPGLPKDERLDVVLSKVNHADNGKFAHLDGVVGYVLTVDDDIRYPSDYVERMLTEVERFGRKEYIGVHGACLPYGPPLTRWSQYTSMRRSHVFAGEHASSLPVDIIGTGTLAFHTDAGIPDFDAMDHLRMVDLHVAVWAANNEVPMRVIHRSRDWVSEFEDVGEERIWQQTQEDRKLQQNMLEVLQRRLVWNRGSCSTFAMRNGPLHAVDGWHHRELPPQLVLDDVENWPEVKDSPLVTIYIPAYNVEKYIAESIESALAQDYPHIEVCVHDDGSTDGTLQVIKALAEQHPTIRFSSAENAGIGAASNRAINLGTGELILQLDGDDVLDPNAVTALVTAISDGAVVAYGNFRRIDPDGAFIDDGWEEPTFSRERLLRSMIVHHPRLFRRDAWERIGGHSEELTNAVDYDLFLRLSEVGSLIHVRSILYSYRILNSSTSRSKQEIQTENTYKVVRDSLTRQQKSGWSIYVPNLNHPRRFVLIDTRFVDAEIM